MLAGTRAMDIIERHNGLNGYGQPQTLQVISEVCNVTKERVRQLESQGIAKIKRALTSTHKELAYQIEDLL